MLKWLPLSPTSALIVVAKHHQSAVYRLLHRQLAVQTAPRPLQYHESPKAEKSIRQFVCFPANATPAMTDSVAEPAQNSSVAKPSRSLSGYSSPSRYCSAVIIVRQSYRQGKPLKTGCWHSRPSRWFWTESVPLSTTRTATELP